MSDQLHLTLFARQNEADSSLTGADQTVSQPSAQSQAGPGPYAPRVATAGNPPQVSPDIAVSALFLALFLIAGFLHLLVLVLNKRQGRKFIFSGLVFFFCTIRVVSCCLRIAWVYEPHNVSLSIAAQLLVNVGTAILFVTNNWFTQRVMRARHPHIGWNKGFDIFITKITELLIIATVITLIVIGVHQFYTLDPRTQHIEHTIMQVCQTIFAVLAFLPLPIGLLMLIIPRRTYIDKFGSGRFRTKIAVLMVSSALLTLESGFRAGILYTDPVPIGAERPWYLSVVLFYVFGLMIEWIIVATYLIVRVDKRFYVPDGASGPGVYSGDVVSEKHMDPNDEYWTMAADERSLRMAAHVASILSPSREVLPRPSTDLESPSTHTMSIMDYKSRHGSFEVVTKSHTSLPLGNEYSSHTSSASAPNVQQRDSRTKSMTNGTYPNSGSLQTLRPRANSATNAPQHNLTKAASFGQPPSAWTHSAAQQPPPPPRHMIRTLGAHARAQSEEQISRPPTIRVITEPNELRGRQAPASSPVQVSPTVRSQSLPRQPREVHMYQHGFQPPGMNPPSYRLIEQGRLEQVRKQRQLDAERLKRESVERARRESVERIRREGVETARRASAERQRRGSADKQRRESAERAERLYRESQERVRQPPAYQASELQPQRRYDGMSYDLPSTYIGIGI